MRWTRRCYFLDQLCEQWQVDQMPTWSDGERERYPNTRHWARGNTTSHYHGRTETAADRNRSLARQVAAPPATLPRPWPQPVLNLNYISISLFGDSGFPTAWLALDRVFVSVHTCSHGDDLLFNVRMTVTRLCYCCYFRTKWDGRWTSLLSTLKIDKRKGKELLGKLPRTVPVQSLLLPPTSPKWSITKAIRKTRKSEIKIKSWQKTGKRF